MTLLLFLGLALWNLGLWLGHPVIGRFLSLAGGLAILVSIEALRCDREGVDDEERGKRFFLLCLIYFICQMLLNVGSIALYLG